MIKQKIVAIFACVFLISIIGCKEDNNDKDLKAIFDRSETNLELIQENRNLIQENRNLIQENMVLSKEIDKVEFNIQDSDPPVRMPLVIENN